MASVEKLKPRPFSGYNTDNIEWIHLEGGPDFDYPIDYWIAVLGGREQGGCLDFLVKWEPDSYCHYHRHLGATTTLMLEGEHHVVETSATEIIHKTRKPGHFVRNPPGDLHMEYAGPQGSVVFFSMQADDGRLFEILDKHENILAVATIEDLVAGRLGQ